MIKKFLYLFLFLLLVGCSSTVSTVNEANSNSRTYLFFKNFDVSHYYVSFWDRNTSINDDTKIIMARNGDKFYYELDGYERNIIIQKDGFRYSVSPNKSEYYKEESEVEDFSIGILPSDINKLKDKRYKTGKEKVFNSKYVFENYEFDGGETTYYYKGNKLTYIRYKSIQNEVLLKFNYMKKHFDDDIFEINSKFNEITY